MTEIRSQPTTEGSTAPTNDEICDRMLGTRPYYVRGLGYGITAPLSSRSSKAKIHSAWGDGADDTSDEAAADRSELRRALFIPTYPPDVDIWWLIDVFFNFKSFIILI